MSTIFTAASDIALVLDGAGVIRDIALGYADQPLDESRSWVGRSWVDTVSAESQPRIVEMLAEAVAQGVSHRRHVNHLSTSGVELPIVYTAVRMDDAPGKVVAFGRDLRAASAVQQSLVEAQQSLERDHWRMRQIETRFRHLFATSGEALLLVDAGTQKVLEANPAAAQLFDQPAKRLVGRTFPFDLAESLEQAVAEQLATVRSHGRADDVPVRLASTGQEAVLSLSLLRQDASALILARVLPVPGESGPGNGATSPRSAFRLLESLPDGFVIADAEGRLLMANRSFLSMLELPALDQARGSLLNRWMGRPGADVARLLGMLREHGVVRLFGTVVHGELGSATEVEVSGIALADSAGTQVALLVRAIGRRLLTSPRGARDFGQAVEQLTSLVGRVSLKDLVRDATDLLERRFIEAALAATSDNRTSAAEVLGLSRQSLYMKLRRYGLGADGETSDDGPAPAGRKRARKK